MHNSILPVLCVLLLALAACEPADDPMTETTTGSTSAPPVAAASDTAAVRAVAARFHEALAAGDSSAVADLLAPDAVVLESGGTETREEYLSHHFHSDAAFLGAVAREPDGMQWYLAGESAWAASTSRLHGRYRDRDVDVNSAELLVLRRTESGWRIAAVHWSSRSRQ